MGCCDECSKEFSGAQILFGCRECDYDLCIVCKVLAQNQTAGGCGVNGNGGGGAYPPWAGMFGTGWGGAGQTDERCWDMDQKGYCPRGGACKYCRNVAMRGGWGGFA